MKRPAMQIAALLCSMLVTQCANDRIGGEDFGPEPEELDIGSRISRTFTSQQDWDQGEANGLNTDSAGQMQMTAGLALYETPFIWIPNSAERTVTKIDTRTLIQSGPYSLVNLQGVDCWNPSRTTVDIQGNVWVGCRGTSSYIERSEVPNKIVPNEVDNKVVKLAKDDGRVLLSITVGHAPRALALDANNHLWIGCSVDDTVWEIDGDTGQCYRGEAADCAQPAIAVQDFPYGMAVDQRGHLWVVHNEIPTSSPDELTEIDTITGEVLGIYGPYLRGGCNDLYGIAIDQLNDIWLGGYGCDDFVKVKGVAGLYVGDSQTYAAGEMIGAYDAAGERTRGVAVDLDGNVWGAMSGTSTATKLNGQSGDIMQVVNVGSSPIGVGVDAYGNAWVVNRGGDSVHRINGLDVAQKTELIVGDGPYTYSDMLGMALRTITHRAEGFSHWRVKIDSGIDDPIWETVHWTANEPANTNVRVRARCAPSESALATAQWSDFLDDPGPMTCPGSNRWAEIEVRFYASATTSSPVLYDLTVYWSS